MIHQNEVRLEKVVGFCESEIATTPYGVSIRLNYANMKIVEQGLNKSMCLEGEYT